MKPENKKSKNIVKLNNVWKALFLTLLTSGFIEIIGTFYWINFSPLGGSSLAPITFAWVWESLAVIVFIYIYYFLKVNRNSAIVFIASCIIVSFFAWKYYPTSYKNLNFNYYGLDEKNNEIQRIINTSNEKRNLSSNFDIKQISAGNLYSASYVGKEINLFKNSDNNYYLGIHCFIFWQSGLAYSFYPIDNLSYKGSSSILNKLELYFTVGPLLIVDCIITGIYKNFFSLLVLQMIWMIFIRDFIWWNELEKS